MYKYTYIYVYICVYINICIYMLLLLYIGFWTIGYAELDMQRKLHELHVYKCQLDIFSHADLLCIIRSVQSCFRIMDGCIWERMDADSRRGMQTDALGKGLLSFIFERVQGDSRATWPWRLDTVCRPLWQPGVQYR